MLQLRFSSGRAADKVDLQKRAEQVVIRLIRTECYTSECKSLRHGQEFPRNSPLFQLKPFMDSDGLLRVGGRLQHTEIDYDARHPVIMGKNHLAELFMHHIHWTNKDIGVESMLALIRQAPCRWWQAASKESETEVCCVP